MLLKSSPVSSRLLSSSLRRGHGSGGFLRLRTSAVMPATGPLYPQSICTASAHQTQLCSPLIFINALTASDLTATGDNDTLSSSKVPPETGETEQDQVVIDSSSAEEQDTPPPHISILKQQLRPLEVVAELNRHIVGQDDAKRAVAIAMRNRWRRKQLSPELRKEVTPRNVLMIGPTGCGKVCTKTIHGTFDIPLLLLL